MAYRSRPADVTNVVSEKPISLAMACMNAADTSTGSGITHNWLPVSGRSVNTSTSRNGMRTWAILRSPSGQPVPAGR